MFGIERQEIAERAFSAMIAIRSWYDPAVRRTVLFVDEIGAALNDPESLSRGVAKVTKVQLPGGYENRLRWVDVRFDLSSPEDRGFLEGTLEGARQALRANDHRSMQHINDSLAERRMPLPRPV